jgi:N-acetylneuraminic acid mutarotase
MKNNFILSSKSIVFAILILSTNSTRILNFSTACFAQGSWTRKADMPTGRWDLSTCVVDGKIYAIGGAGPVYQALKTVEMYDPATDRWETKTSMPTAREGLSTSVINGKIYAIGGFSSSSSDYYYTSKFFSTVEEYNPATDTWSKKKEMPAARGVHSACVVNNRIYIIGGSTDIPFTPVLTMIVYDPLTDSWTQKGEIPQAIYTGCFAGVVNGCIYIVGGDGRDNRVDEYDPVTNRWTRKADMPSFTTDQATCVLNGKIYVIGGENGPSPEYPGKKTVNVYDPDTDSWTTVHEMPTRRFGPRASATGKKFYVIGGMDHWGSTTLRTVEEFDPLKN